MSTLYWSQWPKGKQLKQHQLCLNVNFALVLKGSSQMAEKHSSGAVWELRRPSWAVRPNEPSGFHGRKAIYWTMLRHWLQLVPNKKYVNWHLRTLRITSSWLNNVWHWPESGTVPPPHVGFRRGSSRNKENIKESWVILGMSHVFDSNLMHHYTSEVNRVCWALSAPLSGWNLETLVVTTGNKTDHAHKIWRERLLA